MFIYFLRGTLPWRKLKPQNDENNAEEHNPRLTWDRILKVKLAYEEATFRAAKVPYPSYSYDDSGITTKSSMMSCGTSQRSAAPPPSAFEAKTSPLKKRKSTSLAQSTPAALHFPRNPPMPAPEEHPEQAAQAQFGSKIPSSSQTASAAAPLSATPRKHHNKPRVQSLAQHLPPEFMVFYTYVRSLSFDSMPDYAGCRKMFRELAKREGIEYDGQFDWCVGAPPPPPPPHPPSSAGAAVAVGNGAVAGSTAHNRRASTGSNMNNNNNDGRAAGRHMRKSSGHMRKRFCTACAAIEAEKERVALMESQHRQHHHGGS